MPGLGTLQDQSDTALYVWAGPATEQEQIRITPNPFGADELRIRKGGHDVPGTPEVGQAFIYIYPVSAKGNGDATVKIFDSFGQLVKAFPPEEILGFNDAGRYCMRVIWDGKNEKRHKVANGVYQICARVEEMEGPKVYTQKIGVLW